MLYRSAGWVINKKEKSGDLVPLDLLLSQAFKGTKARSECNGGSLTLASGDGNTSREAVTIDGGDGSTALDGSITISLGVPWFAHVVVMHGRRRRNYGGVARQYSQPH